MAGVSPATVSRALNNTARVSGDAQHRIEDAMERAGYSLEAYKKRRNSPITKMKNIAFLVLSRDVLQDYSSTFNKTTRAVSSAAVEMHMNMIHAYVGDLVSLPPAVANGTIDGLILSGSCDDPRVMKMISKIPKVWLGSHREKGVVLPLSGNESVGRVAAEYLAERGHKQVAFLNAFSEHLAMKTRSEFFEFFAQKLGMKADIFTETNSNRVFSSIGEIRQTLAVLIDQWLAEKDRATGIFIPLDIQAAICYEIMADKGIRPGVDVDIIGCDNDEAALMGLNPKPATIELGAEAMGYHAVQELLWKIDNPTASNYEGVRVVVEPRLISGSQSGKFI